MLTIEHVQDEWGEALLHNDHAAWANGESKTLHEALGRAAPAFLLLAGITRVEHVCRRSAMGGTFDFVFLTFTEASKLWELPKSKRVHREYARESPERRRVQRVLPSIYSGEHFFRRVRCIPDPSPERQSKTGG